MREVEVKVDEDPHASLLIRRRGPVDWVTLNRPKALNALNRELVEALLDYFGGLYFERSVRIVVLRGAGRAFCAGADLKEGTNAGDNGPDPVSTGLCSQRDRDAHASLPAADHEPGAGASMRRRFRPRPGVGRQDRGRERAHECRVRRCRQKVPGNISDTGDISDTAGQRVPGDIFDGQHF